MRNLLGKSGIKPEQLPAEEDIKKLQRRVTTANKDIIMKKLNLIMWLLVTSSVAIAQSMSYMPNIDTKGQSEYQYGARSSLKQTNESPPLFGIDESLLHKQQSDARDCQYTSNAQLANLSIADLIAYLKSTPDYACHGGILFNFDPVYSPIIFSNSNIQAVANEMNNLALSYDGTYANGIYGLMYYLRPATYFESYDMLSFNQQSWNAIGTALNSLCSNPHMFDLNIEASAILEQFIILLDLPGVRSQPSTITFVKQI
ncbi:MAG: M9 family metallopeptidase N-terminal domain-containing protein, partial [Bacteroidales bacterium]